MKRHTKAKPLYFILGLFLAFQTNGSTPAAHAANDIVIEATQDDEIIIPDKYNTGCSGTLFDFNSASEEERIEALGGFTGLRTGDSSAYKINFAYAPLLQDAEYVFENIDFSDRNFQFLGPAKNNITVTFRNCKFKHLSTGAGVKTIVENCTMNEITAYDTDCINCQFGHSYSDGIRAFNNCNFTNCYITDMQYFMKKVKETDSQHIDGVQLFGNLNGKETNNLHFYNCRFEIPTYYIAENNGAGMNNCIYVQIEYSDASDITFENIITNGAGYQYSAHQCKCPNPEGWKLEGISLKNARMGEASINGAMAGVDPRTSLENIEVYNYLYVASSWKDDTGKTHFSVTNDTTREKKLAIITDKETKTFTIPAYPKASVTNQTTNTLTYKDYPIDIDVSVEADKYAVCFDVSSSVPKQVRFINYTDEAVSIDKSILDQYAPASAEILQGECGKKLTFTLTDDGVLTISGQGPMYNYHSAKLAPWDSYYVRKVIFEDGITTIGAQAFRAKRSLSEIVFADTITTIEDQAFKGCSSLMHIDFPASITKITNRTFLDCFGLRIYYLGENWDNVAGGEGNSWQVIGYVPKNGWIKSDNGSWLYYKDNVPCTGWIKDNGAWYYLGETGAMQTGWIKDDGAWYYLASSGKMQTGWVKYAGDWYYIASSGKMKTGWVKDNGAWYYFASSGKMQTGWVKDGGAWYYLASSGKMQTGWVKYDGSWYYFKADGTMATGWIEYNSKWYYMYSNGKMATDTYIGSYYVNADGVWVK